MKSSNLDLFFEDAVEQPLWSDKHVIVLRKMWGKLTPQHKLFDYNETYSKWILSQRSKAELEFIAAAKIPHLSQWAKTSIKSKS